MARNNKTKPPQIKKVQIQNQWLKNVGRSLGMTANEMIGEMMPSTMEFTTSAFETASEVYTDIRENSISGKRVLNALNLEDQWNMGIQGLKNAMDDIKSGKIYNKERIDKLYDDGEDFGLEDFDFDDSFGDDTDSTTTTTSEPKVKVAAPVIVDNSQVVASINAQSSVIVSSAEATIISARQQAANMMMFNQRHSEMMMRGMSTINSNLGMLVNFYTDNMSKYIHASISYYDESLRHLSSTVDELKRMSYRNEGEEEKEWDNQWDSALLSYGGLNTKGYLEIVKKNLQVAVDEDLILSSLKSFITDKDTLQYVLASPLSAISTNIVKTLVPTMLQTSLQAFDETMSNFFPSLLVKISSLGEKHEGNYLFDLISKVFGINNSNKNGIDVSKYNKGPIPFDGVTKKAITDVIPTYLKKILSAVSGQEEMSYDYEKGTYKKTADMQKEFTEEQARRARSGYTDVISGVKTRSNAYQFSDPTAQKAFQEGIDTFFSRLGKSGKFINPYKDSEEDFNDIYNFNGDSNFQRLFRTIMRSLSRRELMALSKGTADSRVSLTQYFNEIEKNQDLAYQVALSNGMYFDDIFEKDSSGAKISVKAGSPFNPVDKYKLSSLDYLRRIENILIEGIRVYPAGDIEGSDAKLSYLNRHNSDEIRIQKDMDSKTDKQKYISAEDRIKALNKGVRVLDSSYDLGDEDEIADTINTYMQFNSSDDSIKDNQKDGALKRIAKFLPKESQGKWSNFSDSLQRVLSAPGRMLSKAVDKLDNTLFSMIFGVSEDGQGYSLVDGMIATFSSKMDNVVGFFKDKVFDPLHEVLFGQEGWFTRFKESDSFAKMKVYFEKFKDYTFGMKNANGFREGGLFADAFNELKDIYKGFSYYFTGKSYKDSKGVTHPDNKESSVFGNIKQIGIDAYNSTKQYVFGDDVDAKGKKKSEKPVIDTIKDSLLTGATNFHKAMFGDNESTIEEHKEIITELTGRVKDNMPKTLAWGALGAGAGLLAGTSSLGLMGSLFLPGGPVGGAIVAMGASLLTQSDAFMDKVFGHKDENGERVGALISASTQKFFKDNKNIIVGAGILGALKPALGLGMLPSFILPGGPIGGALMGVATALTVRSNTFQELMFGRETGEDGKLAGGLLSSFSNKMKNVFGDMSAKNVLGNTAVGAAGGAGLTLMVSKMGLLGSMITPFGPMGGAMLGAAAGIALSSEKWRKAVFGEIDEETGKREGGALGKLGNWMEYNVLMPMKDTFDDVKVNVYKWFGESIAMPFREALYPIKTEISYMIEKTNEMFAKGWSVIQEGVSNTLGKYVVQPFGQFMEEKVMKPLRGFMGTAFKMSLKALQMSIAAPFKLFGVAGHLAERRQERRGSRNYTRDLKEARKNGEIGYFDYVQQRFFDRSAREDAKTAAKVGNAKQMREEAAANGMTFAQYVNYKKAAAREQYRNNLFSRYQNGEIGLSEYLNSRFFDRRSMEMEEDKALGTNERNEYYAKLDADKARFRENVRAKEAEREANRSRRKYLRQLGIDTGYTGFIYEKDKDGNTIANGKKVSVDRVIDALSMNKENMTEEQLSIFNQIGDRLGVKNLLDAYGTNGLDMNKLSKRNRKRLQQGITDGNVNDLLRGLTPYTKEERQSAFDNELANLTKEYGEKLSDKMDLSNKALAELENTFKDAYNLLRVKYGLRTVRFKKNPEADSNTMGQLLLPAPRDLVNDNVIVATKLDELGEKIIASNEAIADLIPMDTGMSSQEEHISPVTNTTPNFTLVGNSYSNENTATALKEAKEKMFAKEKYEKAEEKKKEEIEKNQAIASRKTAGFMIAENEKKSRIKSFLDNHVLQSDMLVSMNKSLSGIAKGLGWAFGKKGILTALFLTILPMILKWLQNRTSGDDSRSDVYTDISNTGLDKAVSVGAAKTLGKAAQKILGSPTAMKALTGIGEGYMKWASSLSEGALKGVGSGADNIASKIVGGSADNVLAKALGLDLGTTTSKLIGSGTDNLANKLLTYSSDNVANKLLGNVNTGKLTNKYLPASNTIKLDDGIDLIIDNYKANSKAKKTAGAELSQKLSSNVVIDVYSMGANEAGDIIYAARETGASKLLTWMKTALQQFVEGVMSKVSKVTGTVASAGSIVSDIMSKINVKLVMSRFGTIVGHGGKLTLELAASLFTDPVMMAYGGITGMAEAERLFRVYASDVDILMRTISAAFKAFTNWSWMFLVEMVNEIIAEVSDIDVFSIIATLIYKAFADNEKDLQLDMAQISFSDGLDAYNKANGTNLSMDAWNDKLNQHLSTKLGTLGSAQNTDLIKNTASVGAALGKGTLSAYLKGGTEAAGAYLKSKASTASKVISKIPVVGKLYRSMVNNGSKVASATMDIGKHLVEVVNEADLTRISKFKGFLSDAIGRIVAALKKKFPNAAGKLGTIVSKVTSTLTDDVLKGFLPQITEKFALKQTKAMVSTGAAATGVGLVATAVIEGVSFVGGAIAGATKSYAANLFQVNQDDVDWIMRGIAAVFKGLLNVSWIFVIEIANDIYVTLTGTDLLTMLASWTYEIVAGEEKALALENDQVAFDDEVSEYNKKNNTSLTKDEYNDTVANQSLMDKTMNWIADKKEEASLRKEAKKLGMSVDELKEYKKNRNKFSDETSSDLSAVKTSIDNLEQQKEAIIASTDENMYKLREIVTATMAGLNVTTFEQLAPTLDLSESQLINVRKVIETTMYGLDEAARTELTQSLNISEEALDGVLGTVQAAMFGLDETTLDKMGPILNISEEKLSNVKYIIEQTLGGMDQATVKNMYEAGQITEEQMNNIFTIMDATMNGMNEETLKALGPVLGITEENMTAVQTLINDTMAGINGETNDKLSDLNVADPLQNARNTIDTQIGGIEIKTKSAFDTLDLDTPFNNAVKNIQNGINSVEKESKGFWETLVGNVSKWWNNLFGGKGESRSSSKVSLPANSLYSTSRNELGGFGDYNPGTRIIPVGGGTPVHPDMLGGKGVADDVNTEPLTDGGYGEEPSTLNNFAYYAQTDSRYAGHKYDLSPGLGHTSDPSLKARGCGPTSMAMVATQLTGKRYLPTTLADMSRKWGHSVEAGTSWSFFPKAASEFSMSNSVKSPSVTGMRSAIQSGEPIIISGRRSKYGKNDSPFTTGGHFVVGVGTEGNSKILINDPRGSSYSKAYDINKVANEARQVWQFKYNPGGSLPTPDGTYTASNTSNGNTSTVGTTSTSSEEELGTWGAFTKMLEAVGIFVGNVTNGTNDRLTWGNSTSSTSSTSTSSSSSGYSSSIIPTTVQDAILKKTLEMTVEHETGGNYTRVKNDTTSSGQAISPSIGIIQMRGNNAKEIMQNMYKKLPNSSEAKYWAEWDWSSRSPWNESQRRRLENYLTSNLSVTKEVQDAHAANYIKNNNLSQVYKYGVDAGKISDPRSIVHLGEIGNTGPAHIKTFMNNYSKHSGGDEFEHYVNQFKAKSYWGRYPIYNNRLNKSYNTLKNWDAKQMLEGGYGETDLPGMLSNIEQNAEQQANLMLSSLMPACLNDSCGGKGEDSRSFTTDRMNNVVNKIMEDVKQRKFDEVPDDELPDNVTKVDFTKSGRRVDGGASFEPDLSDLGGKGGEDTTVDSSDSTTSEIKTLNKNVTNMTNKIISKAPTLLSDKTLVQSNTTQQGSMSETLMLEIISILRSVDNNSGATATGIATISNKDFAIENNIDIQVEKGNDNTLVAVANGSTTASNPVVNISNKTNVDAKYKSAKDIAKGRINK